MPAAVAAVAGVISGAAAAVASVVVPLAASIGAALAPIVSAIGSIVGGVSSLLGSALAPIVNTIGGVAKWVVTSVGQTAGGLVKTIGETVKPFLNRIGSAIKMVANQINTVTKPLLEPIKIGLEVVKGALDKVNQWVTTAFHPSARLAELKLAHPELWEMSQGYTDSFVMYLKDAAIISSTEASLLALPDVFVTINQVATLKVLADLVAGQGSISELLGKVSEGQGMATATAIAQLSKSIVTSTVGIMDRVDTDIGILRSEINAFDETVKSSVAQYADQFKAEVMASVTPKLNYLGDNQQKVTAAVARLARHLEDEGWFAAMLIKVLR